MKTVKEFLKYIDILGHNDLSNKIKIEEDGKEEDTGARRVRLSLYTANHRYAISVVNKSKNARSYLGCISYNRAPHAGETHIRSADLHDGDLSLETWNHIMYDILSHELVNMGSAQFNPLRV